MNSETFVKWAGEYFGKYSPMVKKEVLRKLEGWSAEDMLILRENALEQIETKYKAPPDVHFIHNSSALYHRNCRTSNEEYARRQITENKLRAEIREQKRIHMDNDGEDTAKVVEARAKIVQAPSEAERFFSNFKTKLTEDLEKQEVSQNSHTKELYNV